MTTHAPLPHTRPGTWRDKVAAWAREDLRDYRAHPWLVDLVADDRPLGPGTLTWLDSALRTFDGTGLTDQEILTVINAVEGYVRGHATLIVDADRTARKITPDGDDWTTAQWTYLAEQITDDRFPAIAHLTDPGPTTNDTFEEGLNWLLDGIEQRLRITTKTDG